MRTPAPGRPRAAPAIALALTLAACSSQRATDGVSITGEQRLPTGGTTQLTAVATTLGGRIVHDVTATARWSSSDPAVATIEGGLVTAVGPGTARLRAEAGGASGTIDLTVTGATLVSLDVGPPFTVPAGAGRPLTAIATYTDRTTRDVTTLVDWTSSSPSVANITTGPPGVATAASSRLLAGLAPGQAVISARDPATGVTGSTVVTVTAARLESIAVTPAAPAVALGATQPFTAVGTYSDRTTQDLTAVVRWASSPVSVARFSDPAHPAVAATLSAGTATVTATDPATGISGSATLTVTAARLVAIAVTPRDPSLALGTSQQLTATGTYTDATTRDLTASVVWSSSSTGVAQLTGGAGQVKGVGIGTATVKATDTATGLSGTVVVTVTAARLTSIALSPASMSLPMGVSRQLTATGTYTDGTTRDLTGGVTWQSSAPAVASVSNVSGAAGLVRGLATGSASVTATDAASGISANAAVTVTAAQLVAIAVTPPRPSTPLGTTTQFTAIGTYTDASTQDVTSSATWSSSDPGVATVSNAAAGRGLATPAAVGTTTITATDAASGVSGSATLTVTAARLVSLAVTPAAPSVPSGLTVQFTALGTYTDASTQVLTDAVTWSSSTPAVASISNAAGSRGLATTAVIGTTTITAVEPSTNVSGTATLTVSAAQLVAIAVAPPADTLPLGVTRQLTATGSYTNASTQDLTSAVTWSSSAPAVAGVSNAAGSKGLVTPASPGSTTLTALDPATRIAGTASLTVTAAQLVSIAVTPASATIAAGGTQQFAATATYTDASTQDLTTGVTWSSSDPATATVSNAPGSNGLATAAGVVAAPATVTVTATVPETTPPIAGTATLTVGP